MEGDVEESKDDNKSTAEEESEFLRLILKYLI